MRFLAGLWRLATAAFALAGTYDAWMLVRPDKLVFFTYESNLALAFVMIWAGFASWLRGIEPPAWLKGCVTVYMVVTGLVAAVALPPFDPALTPFAFGVMTTTWAHMVTPVMAVVDFVLFDEHRRMKWWYPLSWLAYLPAYVAFVLVRAHFFPGSGPLEDGGAIPYAFLDLGALGWRQFGINMGIYGAVFLAIGLAVMILDRLLPARVVGRR